MRIAYLLSQFPVLSQTFVMNEIIELIENGHDLLIFSLSRPRRGLTHPEVAEYRLMDRTFYLPLVSMVAMDAQEPSPRLASFGSRVYGGNTLTAKLVSNICSLTVAAYFARLARELQVDVLHSHFYGIASAVTALVSHQSWIPFTYTCHAVDIFVSPDPRVMRRHMEAAARVITPSYYNREYLKGLTGINGNKIEVVRACHSIKKFKSVTRQENDRVILTVGRLVRKKGLHYGLLALRELVCEFPGLRYRIIGDGPEKKKLIKLTESLQLEGNVEFLGSMSTSESFLEQLSQAAFMLLPCIQTKDGDMDVCPLVLQEAMCARVPVVSTNISAIPELVENGIEGFVIQPNEVEPIVSAARSLLTDIQLRDRMGKAGQEKIEQEFNIHTEVNKLLSIWRDISSSHGNNN